MSTIDSLDIQVTKTPKGIVVALTGNASMELCDRLNESLLQVCRQMPRLLVVDMSRLNFICSLGLGGLVVAYLRIQKNGGRLVLAGPPRPISEMLATTKLGDLLPVYDSQALALASD